MSKPLSLRTKLSGNPKLQPIYGVQTEYRGEKITLADPRATRAMVALMDMNAVMGGAASHYGGPAAFAELMSAAHGCFFHLSAKTNKNWFDLFNFVNDAGHCENGLYALRANYGFADLNIEKLKKFRSLESPLTGHGEAHLFPEAILISNGPLGSSLPQSQGLAMADALAGKNRITVTAISDGACMEGEAREALAAIPGFARRGKMAPFVLIISDNNTKLSGRIDQESFSMAPSFASLSALGWKTIHLDNGHDLQKCFDVLAHAFEEVSLNPKVPIAIHAKTIKGIGTKKTAESLSGGHGFPLKSPIELSGFLSEIYSGGPVPKEFLDWAQEMVLQEAAMEKKKAKIPEEKIQVGISNAMIRCRKSGLPLVSITSDLPGSTGVGPFCKEFPADSIDVGVAESNMISVAAGYSLSGYIPIVDTFAQFGVTKGALPLTMSSLSLAPMICVFSHTGFQDAADGASHQALTYLSMVGSIPNVKAYCLTCSEEAEALMTQAIEKFAADRLAGRVPETSVFFLGRENFPKSYNSQLKYKLGSAQIVKDVGADPTKKIMILASGSMLPQAVAAGEVLAEKGLGYVLVNPSLHNALDIQTIKEALEKSQGRVVVVEDHQKWGGLAQTFALAICEIGQPVRIKSLAVKGHFGQSAYNAIDLYKLHSIDSDSIVKASLELLK